MRVTLVGSAVGPAAAVVGTWDPFLPEHGRMLECVGAQARLAGLSCVAVMLDPPPALFIHGARAWPLYDDTATRLEIVRASTVDALLLVRFARRDADSDAAAFIELVCAEVRLRELWLGRAQSLGRGPEGNAEAIARVARRKRFAVRRLDATPMHSSQVRSHLSNGRVEDAIALVGRPPARRRPRTARVRLAWATGRYEAVASTSRGESVGRVTLEVEKSLRGPPAFEWPDRQIARLAFVRGPADGFDTA
jgi:FAD synthase